MCSVNQAYVRKRLGEVAEQAATTRVIFFGEKAQIIAQSKQPAKHFACILVALAKNIGVSEPKAARQERPFPAADTVIRFAG
jgi:hypothetical protein